MSAPPPPFSAAQKIGMFAYARNNQSNDQRLRDEYDCYTTVRAVHCSTHTTSRCSVSSRWHRPSLRHRLANPPFPSRRRKARSLSTKPCGVSRATSRRGAKMLARQPLIETHRRFYYQLQRTVDEQLGRVLNALRATSAYENTIVIFSSDHGDMLGGHGGMHEKWHNAYEETIHVPVRRLKPAVSGRSPRGRHSHESRGHSADVARPRRDRLQRGVQARGRRAHRSTPPGGARPLRSHPRHRWAATVRPCALYDATTRSARVARSRVAHCSVCPQDRGL